MCLAAIDGRWESLRAVVISRGTRGSGAPFVKIDAYFGGTAPKIFPMILIFNASPLSSKFQEALFSKISL